MSLTARGLADIVAARMGWTLYYRGGWWVAASSPAHAAAKTRWLALRPWSWRDDVHPVWGRGRQ